VVSPGKSTVTSVAIAETRVTGIDALVFSIAVVNYGSVGHTISHENVKVRTGEGALLHVYSYDEIEDSFRAAADERDRSLKWKAIGAALQNMGEGFQQKPYADLAAQYRSKEIQRERALSQQSLEQQISLYKSSYLRKQTVNPGKSHVGSVRVALPEEMIRSVTLIVEIDFARERSSFEFRYQRIDKN